MKKASNLLFASVFVLVLSALLVQSAPAKDKADKKAKQDRWEGVVVRSNSDKSTLTVRKVGSNLEKTVQYDSSTRWVSQEHGSKKVNDIDASQVKDGDLVIARALRTRMVYCTQPLSPSGSPTLLARGKFRPGYMTRHKQGVFLRSVEATAAVPALPAFASYARSHRQRAPLAIGSPH